MKALPSPGSDILIWSQGQSTGELKQELRKLIKAKLIPNMFLSNVEFLKEFSKERGDSESPTRFLYLAHAESLPRPRKIYTTPTHCSKN